MLSDDFAAKLDTLPAQPGCYLFKDKKGAVVYVGKAKSLRSRVRSYFQAGSSDERYFVPILQRTVGDLETIVTSSEKEAAILEDSLIKEHQPRYNVKLRDDKSYLSLRIAESHAWPRVDIVRRPSPDGAHYFGPYHSATAARRTLHLVNKHFQLRTCTDQELAARKRPCLQYQIRRCLAPCVYEVDADWYRHQVHAVGLFLDGRHDELSRELDQQMRQASKALEFERAATYRDQLRAVDAIRQEQRVVAVKDVDQDVIGLYREGDLAQVAIVFIREGRAVDTASFPVRGVEIPDAELVAALLAQRYGHAEGDVMIPSEVIVPALPELAEGVGEWLSERRTKRCQIIFPQRGPRVDLLALANENAAHAFKEQRRAADDVEQRLVQLQKRLRLPELPRRIECVDISHLGGEGTVGAVVALLNGVPDKKRYRTFHVRDVTPGDDYAAMYQVLARRFRRGKAAAEAAGALAAGVANDAAETGAAVETNRAGREPTLAESEAESERSRDHIDWDLPDLFVVDGGRGQLNVALAAARDLGLHDLPIVGLAKERPAPTPESLKAAATSIPTDPVTPDPAAPGPATPAATPGPATPGKGPRTEALVDRVYLPGQKNGIPLQPNSAPLFFLARARDEAHRFSNRARERLTKRRRFRSELDDVPGIGPVTRKSLLRTLGTLEKVRSATDDELLAVPGVTRRVVKALRDRYPGRDTSPVGEPNPISEPKA